MIVNPIRRDLKLDYGGVSSALLEKAGEGLQEECTNNAPPSLAPGEFVITSGGHIPGVTYMFHCYYPTWNEGQVWKRDLKTHYLISYHIIS